MKYKLGLMNTRNKKWKSTLNLAFFTVCLCFGCGDEISYENPCSLKQIVLTPCAQWGRCQFINGECVASSNIACSKATSCKEYGACEKVGKICAPTRREHCMFTSICKEDGWCSIVENECRATDKIADCYPSNNCKTNGQCSVWNGECVALTNSDCDKSLVCKTLGRCSAYSNICVWYKDVDCKRNPECKKNGKCAFGGIDGYYIYGSCFPSVISHCKESEDCIQKGLCALGENSILPGSIQGNYCHASSDEDCKAAVICKKNGKCSAKDGKCV